MKKPCFTKDGRQLFRAIGLMSGTSMDAIDVAFLQTDGDTFVAPGPWMSRPYAMKLRSALLRLSATDRDLGSYEQDITDAHVQLVGQFCREKNIDPGSVDCIGFHGQTLKHEPLLGRTLQLGDGARMAHQLSCVVINKFRDNDLRHGGQGAPFVPAYHQALVRSRGFLQPIAILNIGGVSNVTLVDGDELHACDCGPGNALIDDWVNARCGQPYDEGGNIAAQGRIDKDALTALMQHAYFSIRGPKSLDRNTFSAESLRHLSLEDGAATLTAFTVESIAASAKLLPSVPLEWIVVGGGRLNKTLVDMLRTRLGVPLNVAEHFGWAGDAIEAQAFAYLAVRSLLGLPLSWPSTTGVSVPVTGGIRHAPVGNPLQQN